MKHCWIIFLIQNTNLSVSLNLNDLILLLHFLTAISQTMCLGMHSVLTPALVLMVLLLLNGMYAQNLFPPVQSTENFALRQPATATSTCRTCADGQAGSAACNNSCPYNEQQLPEPLDLLEVGTPASGVVRPACLRLSSAPIIDSVMCTLLVCFVRCKRVLLNKPYIVSSAP